MTQNKKLAKADQTSFLAIISQSLTLSTFLLCSSLPVQGNK